MATEVLSWNTADGFGDFSRRSGLIEAVNCADADVAVFPEAYAENTQPEVLHEITRAFNTEGYQVFTNPYEDIDGRRDRHGFLAISRLAGSMAVRSLVSRNAVEMHVHDEEADATLAVFGVHLDDRRESTRLQQTRSLLDTIDYSRETQQKPIVVMGDFNAMHVSDVHARSLRLIQGAAGRLPSRNPGEIQSKVQRIGSILQRLSGMASGTTIELFKGAWFTDADIQHQPTMMLPKIPHPYVQLDHIMVRDAVATDFKVMSFSDLSDHRGIRATIHV